MAQVTLSFVLLISGGLFSAAWNSPAASTLDSIDLA